MVIRVRYGLVLTLLVGCTTAGHRATEAAGSPNESEGCVDRDSDGFGAACAAGADCDDHDPMIHEGCLRCAEASEGCACDEGTQPKQCFLEPTENSEGELMCHEGTRYCRNGRWSGCESVMTYTAPHDTTAALIDEDAGLTRCNDCNVLCYRITDTLDPVDAGLMDAGSNVANVPGGGLTLAQIPTDAGMADAGPTSIVNYNSMCTPGIGDDIDCDGIPNDLDPFPDEAPFATANPSIFLQIGAGQTGTGQIDLRFYLNSADIYFLVDQSGSMAEERDQLKLDLTNGDFVQDSTFECADYDFDHVPNNELKNQGIVGAVKCKIRDAYFGTGFFREIPFSGYADSEHIAFGNYQDITGNVNDVLDAINRLTTIGNNDWPEASMVALHNVLTGNGMYFGTTKRGIPARTDCPLSHWGYPCFRDEAVPIVVLFTDAQFHNGPSTNTYAYGSGMSITAGTGDAYVPITTANESFNGAAVLGDLTSSYKTFSGDTRLMTADLTAAQIGSTCISSSAGPDAVFQFNLTQQKAVTIESTGSQFDTVLGLFTGVPGTPTDLTASTNMNETGASALSLGQAHDAYTRIAGNTSAMAADYRWSEIGCDAATSSPDAVFKFDVSQTTQVALDTSGSSFDTVVGLYAAVPPLPPTYTAIANTNDDYTTAYSIGEVYNSIKAFSGDTSGLLADYSGTQLACTGVDSSAKDAVYAFTLSMPTRVRLSTEGSSFDTVLALYDNLANPVASVAATGNDTQVNAYSVGTIDDKILQVTGTDAGFGADYSGTQFGCSASSLAPDAMFKFHLDTPRDVQIDTIGTSWDTVLSVFTNSNIDPKTYTAATNTNDTAATLQNLGTVNGKDLVVTGGSTSSLFGDYSSSEVSCSSSSSSPDAVYQFHLDTATQVQIDTDTSTFDTVLSLRTPLPTEPSAAVSPASNDTVASTANVGEVWHQSFKKTGSTASLAHNYSTGCNGSSFGKDAVFTFTLSNDTTVQVDTIGTSWDTVLALYPHTLIDADPSTPNATAVTNSNFENRTTSGNSIGALDGQWKRYTGSTASRAANWTSTGCSADASSPDQFFEFTVSDTRNVTISDAGTTAFDAVLQLYRYTNLAKTTWTQVACDHSNNGTEEITTSLVAGTYFLVISGDKSSDKGAWTLSFRDNAILANKITCDDDSGGNNTSKITRSLTAGTYDVVLTGTSSSQNGNYTIRFRDQTWWNTFSELQCQDDISTSNRSSRITTNLGMGDYQVVVKGYGSTNKGDYALRIRDLTNPPVGPNSTLCDDNGGGGTTSKIVQTALAAGDYWVGLKGRSSTSYGSYKVNIKDMSATASGTSLQCDDNGGDSPQSVIERNLQAGTYQVLIKGKTATASGPYKLSVRDVTNQPITRLACANDGGAGTASYLEQSLSAGTYYAVVKGNNPTDKGAFSLSIRDVTSRPVTSNACNDNGSTYNTSKITQTLNPGTYYVALKGKTSSEKGPYQLSIGAGTTHSSTYTPPTWYDTLSALQSTQAKVISILSCKDDPQHGNTQGDCNATRTQANALADASGALGKNLQKLVFDINSDGAGLSSTVVGAINDLAAYLEMNVSVRVIFEPDDNPGFLVTVKAIDQLGDSCSGLIGITHQRCVPGATPEFQILFENPEAPKNVPLNPNDPKGGYNFRAELIGDGQFVVDHIPIYIIPEPAAMMGPPPPEYYPMGTYHQDVASPGCMGNQQPDWRDLDWTADVYGNTSITFKACAAQTEAGLDTCTPQAIAKVSGAGDCTTTADCPVGYCNTDIGVCQITTAGTCTTSAECPSNAYCDSGSQLCTFTSQPVYIGAALGSMNFKSFMRMGIDLQATQPFEAPPVLHRWEMTYICNQVL